MPRVIIVGGTGFIGRHLAVALGDAGHAVEALGRRDIDLAHHSEAAIAARLGDAEVIVNAAGLVRGHGANTLEAVHAAGAVRLFRACAARPGRRLLHISALGAATGGPTAYQRTKGAAEAALATLAVGANGLDWCILRPSVVIGRGGASSRLLAGLAALPRPVRLGPGTWEVQPIHVDDLAETVARLLASPAPLPRRLDVVGPEAMTTDAVTAALRDWLGLPRRPALPLPDRLLGLAAQVGGRLGHGPLTAEVLAMLKAGNVGDAGPLSAVLGRPPRRLADALARHPATAEDRQAARLRFVRPLLRWSLGGLWVATGVLSLGLYPVAGSQRLLAEAGLAGLPAEAALYGGATVDLVLGAALLAGWRPVLTGAAMLAAMAVFTTIATALPAEYWLHPFAPLLKNLPLAAATLAMMALEA